MEFATLLKTKLYKPQIQKGHISRKRLIDILNNGLNGKLTLITAPAGFGKTTLASKWVCNTNTETLWISLEEEDNKLVGIWREDKTNIRLTEEGLFLISEIWSELILASTKDAARFKETVKIIDENIVKFPEKIEQGKLPAYAVNA